MKKKADKKDSSQRRWVVTAFCLAVTLSAALSLVSESVLGSAGLAVALLILALFILLGIVFDVIGVAVTAADPRPFHSMAAHKVKGAREALKLLKNALEEKYEVTATLNGLLVEKILASKPIDLIILDYEMPIMTGADVYRKLKENADYAKIPVCFLTGVSERSKVEEIMSLKPNGYLLKPIDMEMLMAAIANLINT